MIRKKPIGTTGKANGKSNFYSVGQNLMVANVAIKKPYSLETNALANLLGFSVGV